MIHTVALNNPYLEPIKPIELAKRLVTKSCRVVYNNYSVIKGIIIAASDEQIRVRTDKGIRTIKAEALREAKAI